MPKNPADDIPAQSVQDTDVRHTAASCPSDGTLVMCSGPAGARSYAGACGVCKRVVYADASLLSQVGSFDAPPDEHRDPPKGDDNG